MRSACLKGNITSKSLKIESKSDACILTVEITIYAIYYINFLLIYKFLNICHIKLCDDVLPIIKLLHMPLYYRVYKSMIILRTVNVFK